MPMRTSPYFDKICVQICGPAVVQTSSQGELDPQISLVSYQPVSARPRSKSSSGHQSPTFFSKPAGGVSHLTSRGCIPTCGILNPNEKRKITTTYTTDGKRKTVPLIFRPNVFLSAVAKPAPIQPPYPTTSCPIRLPTLLSAYRCSTPLLVKATYILHLPYVAALASARP
ncbi:unnamed protein product [Periconia digitata]|uniref:Uncharacterized protein n=1 Tax=Periconia digitata TaxID=1303443 RepID=A0A9W4UCK9_9PLEO|nr:unnamed protein product [Periconia digitata]